jgi:hypothetical protein
MRQDVYRVALDEAQTELIDISKRFEELRQRKESLESVVAALGPMLGIAAAAKQEPAAVTEISSPEAPSSPAPEPAYTFDQVPAPLADESITDPFQRRVRNALKFSNGNNNNNNGQERRGLQPAV